MTDTPARTTPLGQTSPDQDDAGPHAAKDRLIGRVIDGCASPADWARLAVLARHDAAVWADIAALQADRDALQAAFDREVAAADRVDLAGAASGVHAGVTTARAGSWLGWAAAATLALSWLTVGQHNGTIPQGAIVADRPGVDATDGATTALASLSPTDLLRGYIERGRDEGRVIETPEPVVLDARPVDGGQRVEVVIIRQIVERRTYDRLQSLRTDEHGQFRAVAVPASDVTRTSSPF